MSSMIKVLMKMQHVFMDDIAIAQKNKDLYVLCDGPYGNLRLNYRRYSKILLVHIIH